MSAWWQMLQPWAAVIVPTLLHFLWQGALLALIGGVVIVVCRKSKPSTRYAVFLGLFALMAVTPLITAAVVIQGVPLALPVSSPQIGSDPFATPHWPSQWHTDEAMSQFTAWQPFVLIAWLIGVALCSLRLTGGLMWYVWLTRRLEPIPHELAVVVQRLSQRLGLSARVRVMLSHDVREPLAMRIIQPLIVLPASWLLSAPPLVVEAVLAHELSHIRRHDLWVNLLQRVVETLLFFHPAVWWLSRRIRRERELCCDMLAVAATGRAVEYAQALEAVARFRLAWSSPAMAAGMGGDRMALLERVRRVLGLETAPDAGWWSVGLAGLAMAVVCGAGVMFSSQIVQGDEDKPAAQFEGAADLDFDGDLDLVLANATGDDADPPPREEERPRPPRAESRDGDRRDPPRGEGDRRPTELRRDGERRPEERERDAASRADNRRDGERPVGPPPRDGERRPDERPRGDGERGQQPANADWARRAASLRREEMPRNADGEVMQELLATIRELRQEVQMLREEMRTMRRPGADNNAHEEFRRMQDIFEGRGPRREELPRRGDDVRPRDDGRRDAEPRLRERSPDSRPVPEAREPREPQPRAEGRPGRRDPNDPFGRPDAAPRTESRRDSSNPLARPEGAPRAGEPRSDAAPRTEGRVDEFAPRKEPESKPQQF